MNTITAPSSLPTHPLVMPRPVVRRRSAELPELIFIFAHAPLSLAIRVIPLLATAHALAVLIIGLQWSTSRRTAHRTILAAGYLTGAEVLWRMSGGAIVYEFGKYGCALLLLAAIPNLPGWRRPSQLALLYFVLLLPSILMTLQTIGASNEARRQISFNLSGPFALAVTAFVLSGCLSSTLNLRGVLVAILAPLVGTAAVVGRAVLDADHIQFNDGSNFVTSGGFGPNQVSAALGLGAFVCFFLALQTRGGLWRWVYLGLSLQLIVQAVLTFSRGGVLNAVICTALLGVHFLHHRKARVTLIVGLVVIGALGTQIILPRLDQFTSGTLSQRYGDLDPSLRRDIAAHDWKIFRENPLLGVGPGIAKDHRRTAFNHEIAAHTEYTRMLAEHGIFGLAALASLGLLALTAYLRAPTMLTKAWVATLAGWSMLEMSHAAMRIAAISFLFGLALVRWQRPPKARMARPPANPGVPMARPAQTIGVARQQPLQPTHPPTPTARG